MHLLLIPLGLAAFAWWGRRKKHQVDAGIDRATAVWRDGWEGHIERSIGTSYDPDDPAA